MIFDILLVYISKYPEGGIRARVRQQDRVCAFYGPDLLKNKPTDKTMEAEQTVIAALLGCCRKIRFTFEPSLDRCAWTYTYTPEADVAHVSPQTRVM